MDILNHLSEEHRSTLAMFDKLRKLSEGGAIQAMAEQIVQMLEAHEYAEEVGVWNPARPDLPDPAQIDQALSEQEHLSQELRNVILDGDTGALVRAMERIEGLVRSHIRTEDALFRQIRENIKEKRREEMTGDYEAAKRDRMARLIVTMAQEEPRRVPKL